MSNKTIAQLTDKVPTNTDLVPVADPTTGIAGKSTIAQVANAKNLNYPTEVQFSITGARNDPAFTQIPPRSIQVQPGISYSAEGIWVDSVGLANFFDFSMASLSVSNVVGAASITTANMPLVTSFSFPELLLVQGNLQSGQCPLMTNFSFPKLIATGGSVSPTNMASLTTLSFPELVATVSGFSPSNMASLTSLDVPKLKYTSSYAPNNMAALTTLSAPELLIAATFNAGSFNSVTTFSFPKLVTVSGGFSPNQMSSLTSISMPELVTIGGAFTLNSFASLTSVSLPKIETIGEAVTSGNALAAISSTPALENYTLGSTLKKVGSTVGNVVFTSCALNQASVDNILVRLAALDGTNGTTVFSNRTVTITGTSATPSATGLAAKATLVARGCTVTHN